MHCIFQLTFFMIFALFFEPCNTGNTSLGFAKASSTGLSNFLSTRRSKQSPFLRHASSYYASNVVNTPSWRLRRRLSWVHFFSKWPIRDQGFCGSCWAMASVTAVEAAFAITSATLSPPLLSVQQVIDCDPTGNCNGGWPVDALEYIAYIGLSTDLLYPYTGGTTGSPCRVNVVRAVEITHYEEVKFMGWLGLLLAVQQQPTVVFVEASSSIFLNYQAGIIMSSPSCLVNGVDHSVVLVGYDMTGTPHWIIRNSWGSGWGESGYMRLAIKGGAGVCGINIFPGFYPVVKKDNDPCNRVNFGEKYFKENVSGTAGTVNPCGRFPCIVKGRSNICKCDDPFVAAVNLDGSQTCVPSNVCNFFITNPCGVGECVRDKMGSYSCVCPIGYEVGQYALDNRSTCVPAAVLSGPRFFTVPFGISISCKIISQSFGLSITQLVFQNKALQCEKLIPPGTRLNVSSNYKGCSLSYAISLMDTCESIKKMFNVPLLNGRNSPNPYLDCATLIRGQQVCIKSGFPPGIPVCERSYSFAVNAYGVPIENCTSIIKSKFKGNASHFFSLNPGLYCDRLVNSVQLSGASFQTLLDQVCVSSGITIRSTSGLSVGTIIQSTSGCQPFVKVGVGQNCQFILKTYFGGKQKNFAGRNGHNCDNKYLFVNRVICI